MSINGSDLGATTLAEISAKAADELGEWLRERKNRRAVPYRLERCGYAPVRNNDATDGLWKIKGVRQVIYAKTTLPICDRYTAAKKLTGK